MNALGRGFDVEDVEIAPPKGREVIVEVQASGLSSGPTSAAIPATSWPSTDGVGAMPRAADHVFDFVGLRLMAEEGLDDLVSKKIALREVNDGYAALKDGSLNRVVVTSF